MNTDQLSRFQGAAWLAGDNKEQAIIGGAGGIGSWLALFLKRSGFDPILYDGDRVERHNLGGQLFFENDVDALKVSAVNKVIQSFTGDNISGLSMFITRENCPYHKYMFSGFDNMLARNIMFDRWLENSHKFTSPIFIDGRLNMEQMQIFCVTPKDADRYRERLFNDSQIDDTPCSMKQTTHSAAMIASHMTGFFTNHIANIIIGENIREVPFFWEYVIPINLTVTEL